MTCSQNVLAPRFGGESCIQVLLLRICERMPDIAAAQKQERAWHTTPWIDRAMCLVWHGRRRMQSMDAFCIIFRHSPKQTVTVHGSNTIIRGVDVKPLTAELHLHANCLAASFFHEPQRTVIKRPIQCPATCAFHSLCHSQDEARMLHWVEAHCCSKTTQSQRIYLCSPSSKIKR